LVAAPTGYGQIGAWADALLGYVVPLGAWVAGAILGELQRVRLGLERLTGGEEADPDGRILRGASALLAVLEQIRAGVTPVARPPDAELNAAPDGDKLS
jgi:hypothetical protein